MTTVTFADQGGKTLLTFHELYPTAEALEEAMQGSAAGLPTQLDQLDELLAAWRLDEDRDPRPRHPGGADGIAVGRPGRRGVCTRPASSFMLDQRPWIARGAALAVVGTILIVVAWASQRGK